MSSLRNSQPWIDAYTDNQANLQTFSACLALADLTANSDYRLVLADLGNGSTHVKLKVYRGTGLASEIPLLDAPSAVVTLYTDNNEPRIPAIAVACGYFVLLYRNLRPYFKFRLPLLECSQLETDLWQQGWQSGHLVELLQGLSKELGYTNLSAPSQALLALPSDRRGAFLQKHRNFSIKKQTIITSMTTLPKSVMEETAISVIIVATEGQQIFSLDPEAFTIMDSFAVPGVVALLSATGIYTVDYTILFVTRTGLVYCLRTSTVRTLVQLPSQPVALLHLSKSFITANMDCSLQCYSSKGRKQWTVPLTGRPSTICNVRLCGLALDLVAVAVSSEVTGGSVHLYSGPQLMHSFAMQHSVSALSFGRYGQGENALVSVTSGGCLSVKLLKRTAYFGTGERTPLPVNSQPHNIKLLVPKKSKIFVEQTIREREQCKEMHAWFHRSWLRLNVTASEAYIRALSTATVCHREALKFTAQVLGLGPRLKIQLFIENMSSTYVPAGLAVTFLYDTSIYTVHKPYLQVPMLVPGLCCCLETLVTCRAGISSPVQVIVFATRLILSASINMPPV